MLDGETGDLRLRPRLSLYGLRTTLQEKGPPKSGTVREPEDRQGGVVDRRQPVCMVCTSFKPKFDLTGKGERVYVPTSVVKELF